MGRVIWTDPAIEDLQEIMDFIARDSAQYALRMGERIYESAGRLSGGIRTGSMVPEFGMDYFREILVYPYRVIYETRGEGCYIVAIIHGSRDLARHVPPPPTTGE